MRQARAVISVIAALGGSGRTLSETGAAATWKGGYRYAFDGGRTAGGSPILITYDLAFVPGAARGSCLLMSRGFQSDERIVCHASGDAKTLTIAFHGYEDGRMINRYGVAQYEPGAIPFTLQRLDGGGAATTKWEAFRPDLPASAANPAVYFERIER